MSAVHTVLTDSAGRATRAGEQDELSIRFDPVRLELRLEGSDSFRSEFNGLPLPEQVALFKQLILLHRQACSVDRQSESLSRLRSLLGAKGAEEFVAQPIALFTLTKTGREFRVWSGMPARFGPTHVDSDNKNMIMSFYGEEDRLAWLVGAAREAVQAPDAAAPFEEITLSNGTKVMGLPMEP